MATLRKKELYVPCCAKRVVLGFMLVYCLLLGLRLVWFAVQSIGTDEPPGDVEPNEVTVKYSRGLEVRPSALTLNGKPFRIIGGSFHYFRTRPEQWPDRFKLMKAAGLNTVTTYVAWNVHEKQRGVYDFKADGYDLVSFVKMAHEMGLYAIIRPGPYICAEWEFGGFPSWLLHDPNMILRTSKYEPYLMNVERFFNNLLPLLRPLAYRHGGPIIAFQVENEFGIAPSVSRDQSYLKFLVGLFKRHGINELLLTSDPSKHLEWGSLDELYPTVNFNQNVSEHLDRLKAFRPGIPLMVTEFWPGWFDHWTGNHHTMETDVFVERVSTILRYNASINIFMFVGGTNFGFLNGAVNGSSKYAPVVTSYDYDAPISEWGDVHPTKFEAWRELLVKFGLVSASDLPAIPTNGRKASYGSVNVQQMMALDVMVETAVKKSTTLQDPVFMEFLDANGNGGQSFGWTMYHVKLRGKSARLRGILHDRAQIFLDGVHYKTVYNDGKNKKINAAKGVIDEQFSLVRDEVDFVMIVENMGRVNVGGYILSQRKGFQGTIEVNDVKATPWEIKSLDFGKEFIESLQSSRKWEKANFEQKMPTIYRSTFSIDEKPEDTFLDMSSWSKGIVIINGFNIGRYWSIGPQQTLYVPWPLLKKGDNDILIFELEKPSTELKFTVKPILNATNVVDA